VGKAEMMRNVKMISVPCYHAGQEDPLAFLLFARTGLTHSSCPHKYYLVNNKEQGSVLYS